MRLRGLLVGIAALSGLIASPQMAAGAGRPNVVLILADDLGIFDLGCYGRADHRTPRIDGLAREGARFTEAYASASVCSPTRAALMTGKAPAALRITTFLNGRKDAPSQKLLQAPLPPGLPASETTVADDFRAAGYRTGIVGKWHLGNGAAFDPTRHGFDEYRTAPANTTPSDSEGSKGEQQLTSQAIEFLEKEPGRPFFLYLAHNAPHIPFAAREADRDAHRDAFEPSYAAAVESLDRAVGRLLDAIDRLRLADNTLVAFASDNGGLHVPELRHERITHSGPYRAGKGFLYEGGLRVPLIVRWPGTVAPGSVVTTPIHLTDWRATVRELIGQSPMAGGDGLSLLPLLTGKGTPPPTDRPLCWHEPHYTNQGGRPGAAIRMGGWKLIEPFDGGEAELYRLADDPGEARDLAGVEPERVEALRRELRAWQAKVDAVRTGPNPDFDPERFRALYVDFDPSRFAPASADPATRERAKAWRQGMDRAVSAPK